MPELTEFQGKLLEDLAAIKEKQDSLRRDLEEMKREDIAEIKRQVRMTNGSVARVTQDLAVLKAQSESTTETQDSRLDVVEKRTESHEAYINNQKGFALGAYRTAATIGAIVGTISGAVVTLIGLYLKFKLVG